MKKGFIFLFGFCFFAIHSAATTVDENQLYLYGKKLFQEGFYDAAVLQFEDFKDRYGTSPNLPSAYFYIGESYFYQHEYQDAIHAYLNLFYKFPEFENIQQAQLRLADCYKAMQEFEKAFAAYLRIYEYYSKSPYALNGLENAARIAFQLKEYERAKNVYTLLLNQSLDTTTKILVSMALADVFIAMQQFEEAENQLKALDKMGLSDDARLVRYRKLAQIAEKKGQWQHGLLLLKEALPLSVGKSSQAEIAFDLGRLAQKLGWGEEFEKSMIQAVTLHTDSSTIYQASVALGEYYLKNNQSVKALEYFEKARAFACVNQLRMQGLYGIAKAKYSNQQLSESIADYQLLLGQISDTSSLARPVRLDYTLLLLQTGQYRESVQEYLNYCLAFPQDKLVPWIYAKIARISIDRLQQWSQAEYYLREVMARYPAHAVAPEIVLQYGDLMLHRGLWEEALQTCQRLVREFPDYQTDIFVQRVEALTAVNDVRQKLMKGGTIQSDDAGQLMIELGFFYLYDTSNVQQAIQYFERALKNATGEQKNDLEWLIANSYCLLRSVSHSGEGAISPEMDQRSEEILSMIASGSQVEEYRFNANRLLVQKDTLSSVEQLKRLLNDFPEPDYQCQLYTLIGEAKARSGQMEEAFQYYQMAYKQSGKGVDAGDALIGMARLYGYMGQAQGADSVYSHYLHQKPNGRYRIEAAYGRSRLAEQKGQANEASAQYREIIQKYPFSVYADSARYRLSCLYLSHQKWDTAIQLTRTLLEKDSLMILASRYELVPPYQSLKSQYLLRLAEINQQMGNLEKAKLYFLAYGQEDDSYSAYRTMISQLAKIADIQGFKNRAAEYLEVLSASQPDETCLAQLGELQFELKQYDAAVVTFDKANGLCTTAARQAHYSSRNIVSLLRMDQIPQANVRLNLFRNTYKNLPGFKSYLAQFAVETGEAQLKRKNFQMAQESFEEALKMKDETWTPEADLGIGKVLLITNKTDEALKQLTNMIHDYPGHMVLAKVYLNLGDYYFRNQHLDNALQAFHKILDTYPDPQIVPSAMRYLIRVYEGLRFWDAALGLARQYIADYPDADDIMSKRIQVGSYLINLKEYQRAVDHFQTLLPYADADSEAEIQYWIGKAYSEMGLFERAIVEFLKVKYISKPSRLPWASTALYEAGMLYARLDKTKKAIQILNKIVSIEGAASDLGRIAKNKIDELRSKE